MLSPKKRNFHIAPKTASKGLNLSKIPKPALWFGDLIEQTFTYKENDVTVVEVAQVVGAYFHPVKKIWEFMVYWLRSSDPLDSRPMFEETPVSYLDSFEDECVSIRIRKI